MDRGVGDFNYLPIHKKRDKEAETEGQPVESVTELGCKGVRTAASLQGRTLKRWHVLLSVARGMGKPPGKS